VRVISVKKLKDFWTAGHGDSEHQLKAWYQLFKRSEFRDPQSIKWIFRTASFIDNNRVVFNIAGNKYRLIVSINYKFQIAYIRFIGTHAEYDKINANEV